MATKDEKNKALVDACPGRNEAAVRTVQLEVSTGKGDQKVTNKFDADMPETLADAIALEGLPAVFKRYLSSLAIELQGKERAKLAPEGEKKERKRASYLEELGL